MFDMIMSIPSCSPAEEHAGWTEDWSVLYKGNNNSAVEIVLRAKPVEQVKLLYTLQLNIFQVLKINIKMWNETASQSMVNWLPLSPRWTCVVKRNVYGVRIFNAYSIPPYHRERGH